jgi:hypothetical protein
MPNLRYKVADNTRANLRLGALGCRRREVGMPGLNLLRQAVHNPALAIRPIHQLVQADTEPLGSLIAMSLAEIFEKLINSLAVA